MTTLSSSALAQYSSSTNQRSCNYSGAASPSRSPRPQPRAPSCKRTAAWGRFSAPSPHTAHQSLWRQESSTSAHTSSGTTSCSSATKHSSWWQNQLESSAPKVTSTQAKNHPSHPNYAASKAPSPAACQGQCKPPRWERLCCTFQEGRRWWRSCSLTVSQRGSCPVTACKEPNLQVDWF